MLEEIMDRLIQNNEHLQSLLRRVISPDQTTKEEDDKLIDEILEAIER